MSGTGPSGGSPLLSEAVAAVVDDIANRLRRLGTRQWREPLGEGGETTADLVYALVTACAAVEADLSGDRPAGAPLAPGRPPYDAALADRLAVVGRDLAEAVANQEKGGNLGAGAAVLAGLLVTAKDLRLPRDPALVTRAWAELSASDSVESGTDAARDDAAGDDVLDLICHRLPRVRQLRRA